MTEDEELERIKLRKLMELMRSGAKTKVGAEPAPARPIIASDDDFDELIKRYPVVVVDFWAEWCGPCKAVAPIVEKLAREYAGKAVFLKLNVDENPSTTMRYGIMSIPTLMIFVKGKPVDAIIGALPKPMIEARLRKYL